MAYDWAFWRRPCQTLPAGSWLAWLLMGGRGTGKTRTGAETVRHWVCAGAEHVALIGKTPAEARDVMLKNPDRSGLLDVFPPHQRPVYLPSKAQVRFHTGAIGKVYSGEEPGSLRGPAHSHFWADELPKFQYPTETWDNLMLGLRVGVHPQGIVTTTPLPIALLRRIIADPATTVTRGTTYDNLPFLAPTFQREVLSQYEGTRIGRQELHGELLEDVENALWRYDMFRRATVVPELARVVVGIDPAGSAGRDSDETGIVVAGLSHEGHVYVLADLSGRYRPEQWANKALDAFETFKADRIVAEVNYGGDMVLHTIRMAARQRGIFARVRRITATRSKTIRAEPVSMLYEQGRAFHVGDLKTLEDQLCQWTQGMSSPDRMDALVFACYDLMVLRPGSGVILPADGASSDHSSVVTPHAGTSPDVLSQIAHGSWFRR